MDIREIRKKLNGFIRIDGTLGARDNEYLHWGLGDKEVTLDGYFTLDQLEAITGYVRYITYNRK